MKSKILLKIATALFLAAGIFFGLVRYVQPIFFSEMSRNTKEDWLQGNWNELSKDAKNLQNISRSAKEEAIGLYWQGVAENRKRNHAGAKEYQLQAIKLWPEYFAAHASLANAYTNLGETDKSYEHAQKCIQIEPTYAWCYQALMNYYYVTGDISSAQINAKKATELDPNNKELAEIYIEILKYK